MTTIIEASTLAPHDNRTSAPTATTYLPPASAQDADRPRTPHAVDAQSALERRHLWERRYRHRLLATDIAIIAVVTSAAGILDPFLDPSVAQSVWTVARIPLATAALWALMLAVFGTRSPEISGSGATEYKQVSHATGLAFGLVAIAFIIFEWHGVRIQLLLTLPLGLALILVGRWMWRRWLTRERMRGRYTSRALITGTRGDVEYVTRHLRRDTNHAHTIIGAVTADGIVDDITVDGVRVPVVDGTGAIALQARLLGADSVIAAGRLHDDPDFIKRLSWELEGTAADLVLSTNMVDVAGPRISMEPVDGLPLVRMRIPEFSGARHTLKRALDILLAAIALVPTLVLAAPIAMLIKLDDRGPVFFRQTRIGQRGTEFQILKFRTMGPDAETRLTDLAKENEGAGLLFKMRDDPRITRIGAILRKYSLDELPQFWNVLRGDMSIVGPRPPLPREVEQYDTTVFRRLFTRPGITGLWQVSGRSDLSWEESVRLDLRYVENWSVTGDLMIMWRTVKVMLQPSGAY